MKLNYKKFGEGTPLIILHGLFGMLDNWQTLAKQFAAHFDEQSKTNKSVQSYAVYIVDQRNHGKSPKADELDYYVMAEDIACFMEEHGLEKASILGHSMGGKTAMQFAMDYPDKIDKLIVVDIAPKDYPPGHQVIFDAFYAVDLENTKSRKEAEAQMEPILDDFGVRQFLLKNLNRTKEKGYQWKANLDVIHQNYEKIIENSLGPFQEYDGPTLFIKGGDSERYIELDDWADILSYFTDARLEIIDGAGHWVHAQKPQELFELVVGFLEE